MPARRFLGAAAAIGIGAAALSGCGLFKRTPAPDASRPGARRGPGRRRPVQGGLRRSHRAGGDGVGPGRLRRPRPDHSHRHRDPRGHQEQRRPQGDRDARLDLGRLGRRHRLDLLDRGRPLRSPRTTRGTSPGPPPSSSPSSPPPRSCAWTTPRPSEPRSRGPTAPCSWGRATSTGSASTRARSRPSRSAPPQRALAGLLGIDAATYVKTVTSAGAAGVRRRPHGPRRRPGRRDQARRHRRRPGCLAGSRHGDPGAHRRLRPRHPRHGRSGDRGDRPEVRRQGRRGRPGRSLRAAAALRRHPGRYAGAQDPRGRHRRGGRADVPAAVLAGPDARAAAGHDAGPGRAERRRGRPGPDDGPHVPRGYPGLDRRGPRGGQRPSDERRRPGDHRPRRARVDIQGGQLAGSAAGRAHPRLTGPVRPLGRRRRAGLQELRRLPGRPPGPDQPAHRPGQLVQHRVHLPARHRLPGRPGQRGRGPGHRRGLGPGPAGVRRLGADPGDLDRARRVDDRAGQGRGVGADHGDGRGIRRQGRRRGPASSSRSRRPPPTPRPHQVRARQPPRRPLRPAAQAPRPGRPPRTAYRPRRPARHRRAPCRPGRPPRPRLCSLRRPTRCAR